MAYTIKDERNFLASLDRLIDAKVNLAVQSLDGGSGPSHAMSKVEAGKKVEAAKRDLSACFEQLHELS